MNKAYVLAMVMICFNAVLIWFAAMEFFSYQPVGVGSAGYNSLYDFTDLFGGGGFLVVGLSALGSFFVARFVRINAFAMFMFVNIFWLPYIVTVQVFRNALYGTPEAFQGILAIFTMIMLFIFAMALIQMSNSGVVTE